MTNLFVDHLSQIDVIPFVHMLSSSLQRQSTEPSFSVSPSVWRRSCPAVELHCSQIRSCQLRTPLLTDALCLLSQPQILHSSTCNHQGSLTPPTPALAPLSNQPCPSQPRLCSEPPHGGAMQEERKGIGARSLRQPLQAPPLPVSAPLTCCHGDTGEQHQAVASGI